MTVHDGRTTGIDLYGPTVGDMEAEAAAQVIRSGRLSQGTQVAEVEATVAKLMGAQVVAVSSGSAALDIVIHMLDLQPGDEVIMPSLTFAAGAASVLRRTLRSPIVPVPWSPCTTADTRRLARR